MRGGTAASVAGRARARTLAASAAALGAAVAVAAPASAQVPASLTSACEQRDAADANTANGLELPYFFCDDGVPDAGGRETNEGADRAVAVPQNYRGFAGLPDPALPQPDTGADSNGNIALDVDLSFPDPSLHEEPDTGYPLVVFMHGCCGGDKTGWEADTVDEPDSSEQWHYSNAWFASRGYVVLTYTARGFVNADGDGSTGVTELDHRAFEINDYQHLAGLIAEDEFTLDGETVTVDPRRVVTTGGSYGGGFSWLALTDPTWRSPNEGIRMRLAASAPKYGWTDLVQSLVPNGFHYRDELPASDGSDTASPLGFPKRSIVAGLYASGRTGIPPLTSSHATFPESIDEAFACVESVYDPVRSNPLCASTLETTLPSFVADRSAYYQNRFFRRLESGEAAVRVPVFSAGTFTDPLFPTDEHRRMVERLLAVDPGYPVQEYYGDYQHFAQNKRKEWSDLCGADDEVCEYGDYPGGDLDARPQGFSRLGITTRLNRFVDHYVRPPANPSEPAPRQNVTAALQICQENATSEFPVDEPGQRFTASSFDRLAPRTLRLDFGRDQRTTSRAAPNRHAIQADPVFNQVRNANGCPPGEGPAGPGVATYTSDQLERRYTMIGRTSLRVPHTGTGSGVQLNARMYDVDPDGRAVMVDRGVRRVPRANATTVFDLHGSAWRFPEGHRVRIELAQDDSPYIKASTQPSSLTLAGATLRIPVRERTPTGNGGRGGGDGPGGGGGGDGRSGGGSGGGGSRSGGSDPSGDVDCRDLTEVEERATLDADPSDPFGLDEDGDGVPCEADDAASTVAGTGTSELPFTGLALGLVLLAGLALAGAGATLRRRLRRSR